MKILNQFSEKQRNSILSVWKEHGEESESNGEVGVVIRTLLWNPIEIALLCWAIFFNGPEIAITTVLVVNWIASVLSTVVLIIFCGAVAHQPKPYLLRKHIILFTYSKIYDFCASFSRITHVVILALISFSGRYIQAGILFLLFIILIAISNLLKEQTKQTVASI